MRFFVLLRLLLLFCQVRNRMHGSALLAEAEQQSEREYQ